jgi:hypothetical protein
MYMEFAGFQSVLISLCFLSAARVHQGTELRYSFLEAPGDPSPRSLVAAKREACVMRGLR